jgi:hypothetical protein
MPRQSAVRFFYSNAGYSWDSKTETRNQGRWRTARELARAEKYASDHNWQFDWEDDWSIGSHKDYFGKGSAYEDSEPRTCESCALISEDGNSVLASLGCIDDASDSYRRVIEAELAVEALHEIETRYQREATSAGDVPLS